MCEIFYRSLGGLISWFDATTDIILGNPIWKTHSSYNLGVAITSIAIVVAPSRKIHLQFYKN